MNEELIREILKYVEDMEMKIDWEWGDCRPNFGELEKAEDNEIPAFYYTLKNMLSENK